MTVKNFGKDTNGDTLPLVGTRAIEQTATWTQTSSTASAAAAKTVLAAGTAKKALIFQNQSASHAMQLTWNGVDATSSTGLAIAFGASTEFKANQIPAGKISVYCSAADAYMVAYI